jgi:hypothetical protein
MFMQPGLPFGIHRPFTPAPLHLLLVSTIWGALFFIGNYCIGQIIKVFALAMFRIKTSDPLSLAACCILVDMAGIINFINTNIKCLNFSEETNT